MSSVRLYQRQVERFAPGTGAKVIAYAVRRYQAGELVIHSDTNRKERENVLQLFPIRNKPPFSDAMLRDILDAHYATPIPQLATRIRELDHDIAAMLAQLPTYIEQEDENEN